jgi:hypothetical protein
LYNIALNTIKQFGEPNAPDSETLQERLEKIIEKIMSIKNNRGGSEEDDE